MPTSRSPAEHPSIDLEAKLHNKAAEAPESWAPESWAILGRASYMNHVLDVETNARTADVTPDVKFLRV